ncbi:MAG: hypothetical protein AB7O59_03890 [Pirellulales bacterium]
MTPTPKRRWFRWSLRTMFVVVTVLGGWLAYQVNWIAQRHQFLESPAVCEFRGAVMLGGRAPGALWLLGEPGVKGMSVAIVAKGRPGDVDRFDWELHETVREARRLFPEAGVGWVVYFNTPRGTQ